MDIKLRLEEPKDYYIVESITREAFWGQSDPKCIEHLLAHKLRKVPAFIPELDYVAEVNGKVVGNIMYSKSMVINNDGIKHEVITFGPLSVLPDYQNSGIGRTLVEHTINEAKKLGYSGIIIFGHPDYYPRFGFKRALEFNISTSEGENFDAFMALPLDNTKFKKISGQFYVDKVFNIDPKEAAEFDKDFPYKGEKPLVTIDILLKRLASPAKRAIKDHNIKYIFELRRFSQKEIISWHGIGKNAMLIINNVIKEYLH